MRDEELGAGGGGNIIKIIKGKRMKWVRNAERVGKGSASRVLAQKSERKKTIRKT
jgi:hypothetical protein